MARSDGGHNTGLRGLRTREVGAKMPFVLRNTPRSRDGPWGKQGRNDFREPSRAPVAHAPRRRERRDSKRSRFVHQLLRED